MLLLEFQKQFLLVVLGENLHGDPFCDLRSVNAGGIGQWNIGFFPDGRLGQAVCAGAEEVNKLDVLEKLYVTRESSQCNNYRRF